MRDGLQTDRAVQIWEDSEGVQEMPDKLRWMSCCVVVLFLMCSLLCGAPCMRLKWFDFGRGFQENLDNNGGRQGRTCLKQFTVYVAPDIFRHLHSQWSSVAVVLVRLKCMWKGARCVLVCSLVGAGMQWSSSLCHPSCQSSVYSDLHNLKKTSSGSRKDLLVSLLATTVNSNICMIIYIYRN